LRDFCDAAAVTFDTEKRRPFFLKSRAGSGLNTSGLGRDLYFLLGLFGASSFLEPKKAWAISCLGFFELGFLGLGLFGSGFFGLGLFLALVLI
jgi:hypothetical protein